MGRGTRQGAGSTHHSGARVEDRDPAVPRQFNERSDPPLPKYQRNCMKTIGYNKPLYIQPFDHRGSFATKMFGWRGNLTPEQSAEIASMKRVIFDGFKAAVEAGAPKDKAGILVDEQFGA